MGRADQTTKVKGMFVRPEQFTNAHRAQGRILSLPMFAEITPEQQHEVIELVRKF